jgi:predicted HicB family RNase H-like nuclease
MEILKYKDFEGSAELDMQRGVCKGRILFIDDVVTYESKSIQGLQKQFEEAVLDYIETCRLVEKEPQKSCRGQFNVRVAPELHRAAARRAVLDGTSLNDVVCMALSAYLQPRPTEPARRGETFEARVVHPAKELAVGRARLQAKQLGSAATTVRMARDSANEITSFFPDAWQATSSAAAVISQDAEPPYAH